MTATVTTLRNDERLAKRDARFPDLPDNMKALPVDERGFPVPWFVAWTDGVPAFQVADGEKMVKAVKFERCWVCGGNLGKFRASVIGPMCAVNRTISEPQSHVDCARWSAKNCPFLSKPRMTRLPESAAPEGVVDPAGEFLKRNPGACAVWISRRPSEPFNVHGGVLFDIGEPDAVEWYSNGREAFREEVLMSIKTGLPKLLEMASRDRNPTAAYDELGLRVAQLVPLLPRATGPNVERCSDCGKETSDLQIIGCTKGECPLFEGMPS